MLAAWTGGELIRLQCYEGIDAAQAVYDWDYARQLLHLRAAEASGEAAGRSSDALEAELYQERFLVKRALLRSIEPAATARRPCCSSTRSTAPTTSSRRTCSRCCRTGRSPMPELGVFRADDAAARGAHEQPHPRRPRRAQAALPLPLGRAPDVRARGGDRPPAAARRSPSALARQVAAAVEALRGARPLQAAGRRRDDRLGRRPRPPRASPSSTSSRSAATLGTVLKYREDHERVAQHGFADIVKQALGRASAGRPAESADARTTAADAWRSRSPACSAGRARHAGQHASCRSPRRSASSASSAATTSTGPGGRRWSAAPRTSTPSTGRSPCSSSTLGAADGGPEPSRCRSRSPSTSPTTTTATSRDDGDRRATTDDRAALQHRRGAAPPRLRRLLRRRAGRSPPVDVAAAAHRLAAARRCACADAATHAGAPTSGAPCAPRVRTEGDPIRRLLPARRRRSTAASCCCSTSAGRWSRTPAPCCASSRRRSPGGGASRRSRSAPA